MPRLRQIALNNNAGAFVDILATIPARLLEMREDDAAAATGVQIKSLLDNFATTNIYASGSEPVLIPNQNRYPNLGPILGFPQQNSPGAFNYRAADKLVSARGNGAGATTLRFTEYE